MTGLAKAMAIFLKKVLTPREHLHLNDKTFHSFTLKPSVSLITPERAETRTTRVTLYSTGFIDSPDSLLGPSSSLRSLVASLSTLLDTPRRSRLLA